MTTYKEIRGQLIRKVSEDPTNPVEGQIWYNTTTGILKGLPALEAWSSSGSLSTPRRQAAGAGTQTAGLAFGGENTSTAFLANTEEYNGSGYSTGGDLGTARTLLWGCGTQTAGLAFGGTTGSDTNVTEEYDGSAWTAGGALSVSRRYLSGTGIQTAGLAFGGFNTANVDST